MATLVKFRKDLRNDEIIAVFPKMLYNELLYSNDVWVCYAHIGQHSSCNKDYLIGDTIPAKESEYLPLKKELEQLGYELKISNLNRF